MPDLPDLSDLFSSRDAVIVACGVTTFLLRFLPIWLASRRGDDPRALSPWLLRLSQAAGPAAIAAMLVVSLGGFVAQSASLLRVASIAVSLAAVWFMHRRGGGLGSCTFAGALAYGLWRYVEIRLAG